MIFLPGAHGIGALWIILFARTLRQRFCD